MITGWVLAMPPRLAGRFHGGPLLSQLLGKLLSIKFILLMKASHPTQWSPE